MNSKSFKNDINKFIIEDNHILNLLDTCVYLATIYGVNKINKIKFEKLAKSIINLKLKQMTNNCKIEKKELNIIKVKEEKVNEIKNELEDCDQLKSNELDITLASTTICSETDIKVAHVIKEDSKEVEQLNEINTKKQKEKKIIVKKMLDREQIRADRKEKKLKEELKRKKMEEKRKQREKEMNEMMEKAKEVKRKKNREWCTAFEEAFNIKDNSFTYAKFYKDSNSKEIYIDCSFFVEDKCTYDFYDVWVCGEDKYCNGGIENMTLQDRMNYLKRKYVVIPKGYTHDQYQKYLNSHN